MRQKAGPQKAPAEQVIQDIRRATRKHHGAEDKIRIVLEGLRGEESIAALCRREGIAESLYYSWSKEFLEAGKRRLAGDTARAATVEHYNHRRFHASLGNLTPADVYKGRGPAILLQRERTKRDTIKQRRLLHRKPAA